MMKQEINLFGIKDKKRDYAKRKISPKQKRILKKFGREFWDDPSFPGYGGYFYNGKYKNPVESICKKFELKKGMKVLDVGCGKGFMLYDFIQTVSGLEVKGVDISDYAIKNSLEEVKEHLSVASCTNLPFSDQYFDLVICIDVLQNLTIANCKKAIQEITRVSKGIEFIMLESFNNKLEKKNLEIWETTIVTSMSTLEWKSLFKECNYKGIFWFKCFK